MIFNKNSNGSTELKDLIGFIYKSIRFENLTTYIGFSEEGIQDIIGKDVFKTALDHYNSEHYKAESQNTHPAYRILDELVRMIQFPVAMNAYRNYVPSLDVQHTDKGRKIIVTEEEKPAFEWQTEKDNLNLVELENRGIDLLLKFLDEKIDLMAPNSWADNDSWKDNSSWEDNSDEPLIPWGTSKEYEATKDLLINKVSEFDKVFVIKSRRTFLGLVPFIRYVQDNMIRSAFLKAKFDEILDQIKDGDLTIENELIVSIASQSLALLALSMAIRRLSVEVLPDGIFTPLVSNVIKSKSSTTKVDRNEVSSYLEKDGAAQFRVLQEHLRKLDLQKAGLIYAGEDSTERMKPDEKFIRL